MAFDDIVRLPISTSGNKPDAEGETWNTGYDVIDGNFATLENAVVGEYWDGDGFSVPANIAAGNGHVIQDEGVSETQRSNLDFIGASVVVENGGNATEVTINGAVLAKNIESITADKTLTDASEPIQVLTPDADWDVNLPAEAVTNPIFMIINPSGSGFTLTVKSDLPATITTVEDGETKMIIPDGATWHVLAGGGGGAAVFTDLTDTPASYSGESLKAVRVNVGETALEFFVPSSFTSPLTTKGDLFGYDTGDERIPIGGNDQALIADSTQALGLKWADIFASPLTTKGDLHGYSTVDARLPVGANGEFLTADSGESLGLKWGAIPDASETVKGIVEIATTAEIDAGTSETLVPNVDNLAESDIGTKGWGYSPFQSDEAVVVGDGKDGFTVPAFMDGWIIKDFVVSVHDKGITGTTDVQLRRRRAGSDVDVMSVVVTLGDEFFASDGTVNPANDDLAEESNR